MGMSGRVMTWDKETILKVVKFSNNNSHAKIREYTTSSEWYLIGFYGSSIAGKRLESWELLARINLEEDKLWCVVSKFNEILA